MLGLISELSDRKQLLPLPTCSFFPCAHALWDLIQTTIHLSLHFGSVLEQPETVGGQLCKRKMIRKQRKIPKGEKGEKMNRLGGD